MKSSHEVAPLGVIAEWSIEKLRVHPEAEAIFDPVEGADGLEALTMSIREHGVLDPVVAYEDGRMLSGRMRVAAAEAVGLKTVPVRVIAKLSDAFRELSMIVRLNTDRRTLNKEEVARAFKRLTALTPAEGGTRGRAGRPPKTCPKLGQVSGNRGDTRAAAQLGVTRNTARACVTVFDTEGVPDDLRAAVKRDVVGAERAASAIRAETKRQGGALKDGKPLLRLVRPEAITPEELETARQRDTNGFARGFDRLCTAINIVESTLRELPLARVSDIEQARRYREAIHDLAQRLQRELTQGPGGHRPRPHLTPIKGGKA